MNNKYDEELKKNDFLKRHDECLPYIGEKYDVYKLLIIGESHYIGSDEDGILSSIIKNQDYYKKPIKEINNGKFKEKEYIKWIDTRTVFTYRKDDKVDAGFFFNIASEIAKVIYDNPKINILNQDKLKDAFKCFAFINYFKRPSLKKGKEIEDITNEDKKYAFDITKYIIDVIKPKYIAFVSKKSYHLFKEEFKKDINNLVIKAFSHPSCAWWNRKNNNGESARKEFAKFLKEINKEIYG